MTSGSISRFLEFLTPIWGRVLQRQAVSSDENFLDFGGPPEAAMELFTEIGRLYGREICPLLIYQAPTLLKLAGVLDHPEPPAVASLLPLNTASGRPPIFIGHGIGGTVMGFSQLVQSLRSPLAIYGMQAKGVDGRHPPFDRIEDMALYHLESIRRLQPRGPYFLIGYSLGGNVSIEIARRLMESGQEIGLLILLDSYPDIRQLKLRQRVRLTWQRAKQRASALRHGPRSRQKASDLHMFPAMRSALNRVIAAQYEALRRYKPSFYPGKIVFVRASKISHFPDNPRAVWGHLVREIEFHSVPCDHQSMLTTHADMIAAIIQRCLQTALAA